MLDWLHWGGQLILSGGAGQSYSLLRESFLGPYLPAEATGETVPLCRGRPAAAFAVVSAARLSPASPTTRASRSPPTTEEAARRYAASYQAPVPIRPAPKRPVYLSVLKPKPGASTIPLGEASPHLLAVESRVGRGRITMLAINPERRGAAGLARARHADSPGDPPAAGRTDRGEWSRSDGFDPQSARAGATARAGPELVSDHQPRRGLAEAGSPAGRGRNADVSRAAAERPQTTPRPSKDMLRSSCPAVADWRDTRETAPAQPRLARGGFRHHDPELAFRPAR